MVTEIAPTPAEQPPASDTQRVVVGSSPAQLLRQALLPLASLKFTVALFGMAIFIVLAGTFAQWEKDINQVIDEYFRVKFPSGGGWLDYFRAMFVKIDFRIFLPPSFFPNPPQVNGGFYFPKGWLIGTLMAVNLLAAHALRFKMQAKGPRLYLGWGAIALGALATWVVVASGSNSEGLQTEPLVAWSSLWNVFSVTLKLGLALGVAGLAFAAWQQWERRPIVRWILVGCAVVLLCVNTWFIARGEAASLNDSSMRILWLLMKATASSLVLLAGCLLVFRKRAGIVLLHAGIGLLMFNELLVGTTHKEAQMIIEEGETVNFTQNINALELAIIDRADEREDRVVAVPLARLKTDQPLSDAMLPFQVELLELIPNARLAEKKPGEESRATAGAGLAYVAEPIATGTGADVGGQVDLAAAYVKFTGPQGEELGTRLLALELTFGKVEEKIKVGDKTFDVSLRFERDYKPYSIHLVDLRKDDYLGTSTVKNYSSDIRLVDQSRNVDRELSIWMNNPLRFAGETFYQSNYHFDPNTGMETTTFQVVANNGWMIPYVSCMIVVVGMIAQFGLTLSRFLKRREQEDPLVEVVAPTEVPRKSSNKGKRNQQTFAPDVASPPGGFGAGSNGSFWRDKLRPNWFPIAVAALTAVWLMFTPRGGNQSDFDLRGFGQLPLAYEGRVKPLDTLARTSLRQISGKQTAIDPQGQRQPAIRWLLDLAVNTKEALEYRVFRIDNPDVLQTLKLQPRSGYLYSFAEFNDQFEELLKQARLAHEQAKKKKDSLSVYQRKVLELEKRIGIVDLLVESLTQPSMKPEDIQQSLARVQRLMSREPPLLVPPLSEEEIQDNRWQTLPLAVLMGTMQEAMSGKKMSPATSGYVNLLNAYKENTPGSFNAAVADYQAALRDQPNTRTDLARTTYEAAFNQAEPFYHAMLAYGLAFLLSAVALLGWSKQLNRAAFWMMIVTLVYHTWALYARMEISGRPPVTNLYSSAIFIGWGCVVIGLILESVFRIGVGNIVASATGFGSLMVAHMLTTMVPDHMGDTLIVMQAVLDTQFWLATHVVCITLGYATTFLAGFFGLLYIVLGVLTPTFRNSADTAKVIIRMTYGTLCFALAFSFFGTVLGGLWADDSWGRFWGWDPKENGALIIVLWNALVLHARWDGMVKDRGLAILAVGGNIATAWSWFGVNELGVGMHSYGFTEGVLRVLVIFGFSQLAIMGLGMIPRDYWLSFSKPGFAAAKSRGKR